MYQSRFKSFPVENDGHFLVLCRYAEGNPLRAGLVARAEDWKYGSLWEWLKKPRERQLLSPWPIPRTANWVKRVNQALTGKELAAVRTCVERGRPFGGDALVQKVAHRGGLDYALRPIGRPSKSSPTA